MSFTQGQVLVASGLTFIAGILLTILVCWAIYDRMKKSKTKRTTPFIQSILSRYTDLMYDEKYSRVSDREFIKLLRDTALVMLWLVIEASIRLTKKVEKAEEKKT